MGTTVLIKRTKLKIFISGNAMQPTPREMTARRHNLTKGHFKYNMFNSLSNTTLTQFILILVEFTDLYKLSSFDVGLIGPNEDRKMLGDYRLSEHCFEAINFN